LPDEREEASNQTATFIERDAVVKVAEPAGEQRILESFVFENRDPKRTAVLITQTSDFANSNLVSP
jgi:O-glycosyl hydrolase